MLAFYQLPQRSVRHKIGNDIAASAHQLGTASLAR